jgi:hypothetical protein
MPGSLEEAGEAAPTAQGSQPAPKPGLQESDLEVKGSQEWQWWLSVQWGMAVRQEVGQEMKGWGRGALKG